MMKTRTHVGWNWAWRALWTAGLALILIRPAPLLAEAKPEAMFSIKRERNAVLVQSAAGHTVLRYQLEKPPGSELSVESGCYFHPVTTPKGIVITEVAPPDHLHHRGVFLAWVEMHGQKDADFWGWGEHAPKNNRQIVNREITDLAAGEAGAGFRARNEWLADGDAIVVEELRASIRSVAPANILDLEYSLTPKAEIKLAQWAFSGFCVRTPKDGKLEAFGPSGLVNLPNPKHTEPTSDWPAAPWYDYTLSLDDGQVAGVAVIDHPRNPPSLWHNHRDIRMLNPCLVAPGPVVLKAGQPLVLRYRVVAHDGPVPRELLDRLSKECGHP